MIHSMGLLIDMNDRSMEDIENFISLELRLSIVNRLFMISISSEESIRQVGYSSILDKLSLSKPYSLHINSLGNAETMQSYRLALQVLFLN